MAYTYNGRTEKPANAFEQVPPGDYVVECIKAERGFTKKNARGPGGDRKVDLTLLVEGKPCVIFHCLTVKGEGQPGFDLCNWQIGNALEAFGIVTPDQTGFAPDFESAEWVDQNFVGNRTWARVKLVDDYRDKDKPAAEKRKRNEIDEFLLDKELPPAPTPAPNPNGPKF